YDDEEEFVYSEEEEEAYSDMQSPSMPSSDKLTQAQKQADSVAYNDDDDFDYLDADDDADDEQPTSAIQQSNKPWEVDFKAHDLSDLQGRQEEIVNDLEPLLAVSRGSTALLLRSYEWKTESLVEDYLGDSNKVLTKTGVHAHPPVPSIETGDEDFTCEICYCSGSDELYMGLVCGHRFCTSCYETYVTIKIQEGESWLIPCPAPKCKTLMGEEPTRLILAENKDMLDKYECNLARSFVKSSASLAWCPAPSCEYAIECVVPRSAMDTTIPIVNCKCGKSFCFGCKVDNHVPSPCDLVKKWLKKCEDDSETAHWIKANTKEYNNHEQSAKFVLNLLEATEKNMEQLQREMTLAWIDVVFLKNAVEVLTDCRAALKWTYVLAYYMVSDNQKVLFENNQSDLEMATEQLNELVEDPSSLTGIGDIKRKVLDMTHYVKARLDTLLTDTYQGLQEGRWKYED
ncbi:hypothetical protein H4S03_003071, partial [Coemansia sp. S3946]